METAKLFTNGRSQAVRLPKSYRFKGKEIYIKKTPQGVLLMPKTKDIWEIWEKNLLKYDEPILEERNQPKNKQVRESLDEIFD